MGTEDRKPDQNILGTAEACDGLNAVIHKLRAVEAAARGTDIGPESEGLSRIVADLWREVEEIHDLVRGVNAQLRENGSPPHGDGPGTVTLTQDEVETLLLLHSTAELASDGELGSGIGFDRTPTTIRPVWKAVCRQSNDVAKRLRDAAGRQNTNPEVDAIVRIKEEVRS